MYNGNGHNSVTLEPDAQEAAEATLGAILVDGDTLLDLGQFLKPEDFYLERHRWIYQGAIDLFTSGRPVDLVLLSDLLKQRGQLDEVGGESYLIHLLGATPTAIHALHYGRLVERDSLRRKLLQAAGKVSKLAYSDLEPGEMLAQAGKTIFELSSSREENGPKPIRVIAGEVQSDVETLSQAKGKKIIGLPTGLGDLDKLLGGLQRSHLIVLAGRPGMGKSSLATQIPLYTGKKFGSRSLFFSLEMEDKELTRRLISAEAKIEEARIKTGNLQTDEEWERYYAALKVVSNLNIVIDNSGYLTPSTMRSRAMKLHYEQPLDLIIVDYLQLMRGDGRYNNNRTQEVSDISRACKLLARELNIPVLALSQLSRNCESRHDKRPMLSDLRDSGSIEADADEVIFIYRDEIYNPETTFPNVAELILSKHRGGPTGVLSVFYRKQFTYFSDLEVKYQPLEQV